MLPDHDQEHRTKEPRNDQYPYLSHFSRAAVTAEQPSIMRRSLITITLLLLLIGFVCQEILSNHATGKKEQRSNNSTRKISNPIPETSDTSTVQKSDGKQSATPQITDLSKHAQIQPVIQTTQNLIPPLIPQAHGGALLKIKL
jgi:hypothetical protein